MKAAVLTSLNADLEIINLNIPELKKGQVLVDIKAAGVCGAQLNQKKDIKIKEKFLPCLMGHEGSGIVEKVGPGVEKVKPGDKVSPGKVLCIVETLNVDDSDSSFHFPFFPGSGAK